MNESATVTTDFLHKVRGFCNMFASQCHECVRRSRENCAQCVTVNRAKEIVGEIDNAPKMMEQRYFVADRNEELFSRIRKAIIQAGRPVYAKEIRLDGTYKQKKFWAIRRMVKSGIILARPDFCGRSMFYLNPRKNKGKEY